MAATARKVKEKISNPDEERLPISFPDVNTEMAQFAYYPTEDLDLSSSHEELENWFETEIGLPCCYNKIAELAFYKAESRDFEPGHELDDWLEAEREFLL
jgi:hypothetical protein